MNEADAVIANLTSEVNVTKFWSRVKIGTPNECWIWARERSPLARSKVKYPNFYPHTPNGSRPWRANRYAYLITHGAIPEGLLICHRCDNPRCVNPNHLFAGTSSDNLRDCSAKGRCGKPHGEAVHSAKLTEASVRAIRNEHLRPWSPDVTMLARRYGITPQHLRDILKRKKWAHVA